MYDNNVTWQELGSCYQYGVTGPEDDLWFEAYERSDNIAKNVDAMCMSCPVIDICLKYGIDNKLDGVWGSVYIKNGRMIEAKNRHKTEKVWDELKKVHESL